MRLLYSEEEEQPVSKTLIAVSMERLRAEFDAGVKHQQEDEHWRKQVRIATGLGSVGALLLLKSLGMGGDGAPYIVLMFNCFLHVLL
jgi:hypothetical protein